MTTPHEDAERLLSLRDRVAVVAGGAGGIGSAIVRTFLRAGAHVIVVDRPGVTVEKGARLHACDLADADAIQTLFDTFAETFSRLDILVHAAGITRDGVLWKMETGAWNEVLRVNLDSAFHLLRGATPLLRQTGGGSVILVTSINGERGKFGQTNYAASKAGLIGLGRSAAREMGAFGVRVNMISPGMIRTPMTETLPEDVRALARNEGVLGRPGEPDDVAHAALFLASDMSRHVTGQVLRVDGGQLIG